MKKESHFEHAFAPVEAPLGLKEAVVLRIADAQVSRARWRLGSFGIVGFISAILFVPALEYAAGQLYASGLYDYFALLISQGTTLLPYWREFSLSLLEALPSLALLLLLPLVVALVWSIRGGIKSARFVYGNA